MSTTPLSGCLSSKQISALDNRLNELPFEFGTVLDEAFYKLLTAEFNICDAADVPANTGGVQQFLCITDGVCTFLDKSDVVQLNQTVTSISFNQNTNVITYVDEAGVSQNLNLSSLVSDPQVVTSISFDAASNTISYVDEAGNTITLDLTSLVSDPQVVTTIAFDANTNVLTYVDEAGNSQTIDLTSLVSAPQVTTTFVHDATNNTITYTSEDGTVTTVPLAVPETPRNCFFQEGDKTQQNAANKICDAIENGKTIGFTEGDGEAFHILSPATEEGVLDFLEDNEATNIDVDDWTYGEFEKIAVCCEEQACGLQPRITLTNAGQREVNNPGNVIYYADALPYQLPITVTNATTGALQNLAASGAWTASNHIVVAGPPEKTTFSESTVTTDDGQVCEPEFIEWAYYMTDIDVSSVVTLLNPQDVNNVITTTNAGTWAEDPAQPGRYELTVPAGSNPNAQFRVFADPGVEIVIQTEGVDFVASQFRQTVDRAAVVTYVCDPSIEDNLINAVGPNDTNLNPSTIDIN